MFHLKAIQMIAKALPKAADGDPDAADQMAMAQYIAGTGYSNVGLGLVHGMSHPLGAFFNAPHGLANGILLPAVLEYNAPYTGEKYRDIAAAFDVDGAYTLPIEEVRKKAVDAIREFAIKLGNPTTITSIGATAADIEPLAEAAFKDVCTGGNPRKTSPEEIAEIYHSLL
ncbi:MAG: iron-containing alcohol dehydrogenase [Ancrocorticia sp.]|jgi:lactaldehyde reductase|nr:iron-containing alcohol dehydrogenase [Ancrocorticia sp.]MCI2193728.1 iron-containing alcohol dehydrogenase [Ancrocorticia sp.]MCI2199304.1 iron-containing alcohol dehydrogenase [Ancrocorticia sp.]